MLTKKKTKKQKKVVIYKMNPAKCSYENKSCTSHIFFKALDKAKAEKRWRWGWIFPLQTFSGCIHQLTLICITRPCTQLTDVAWLDYKWAEDLKEESKLQLSTGCTKKSFMLQTWRKLRAKLVTMPKQTEKSWHYKKCNIQPTVAFAFHFQRI